MTEAEVARNAVKGKKTNVKFTYIHTYTKVGGSISFTADTNKLLACGISLSSTEKQWQIEVDVPGLSY